MKKNIVLVGGGGHCKVIISILKKLSVYNIIGIADMKESLGEKILNIPINFTDDDLPDLYKNETEYAFIALGSVGNPEKRIKLFNKVKKIGFIMPSIISSEAIVDETVKIGEGTVIMPGVIINADAEIGTNCIINTGTIIEHDCKIGDHVHLAPGTVLSGGVSIGNASHIGTGARIIQGLNLGNNIIVGAGAVVLKDVPDNQKVYGVPAKNKE